MKITKYVHSCLLVEDEGKAVFIDPGKWSMESAIADLANWPRIDYVLVTHEHPDHMDINFIDTIRDYNPECLIISNKTVTDKLDARGMHASISTPSEINMATTAHAPMWTGQPAPPENSLFTLWNKLTHVGDSFQMIRPAPIVAMPIVSPWGSFAGAMELLLQMQPQAVIPIHDWHLSDEGKVWYYELAEKTLSQAGIQFFPIGDSQPIEINI
ncbi:MBL fold metallo-hydrolase [Candidatus Saccharibacteria bacterium]|jgi:L-ascorbate metabolism protein UlaG (beta-lactamase superfamily)|nr:MBL fold metallo-hydrolase [Candidatus Saccharibacteria bacterium]